MVTAALMPGKRTSFGASRAAIIILALVIAAGVMVWPLPAKCAEKSSAAEKPAARVTDTKVVIYQPAIPSGRTVKGSCWTGSIAVPRKGAWRCMTGNMIHDPCFSIASRPGVVVCGADPALKKPGFVMKLTKPLPTPDLPARMKPEPWIMLLADGSVCEKMTGTMAVVDGKAVGWGCNDSAKGAKSGEPPSYSGILGQPRRGKVWTVEKIRYAPTSNPKHPVKLLKRKTVAVRTVWR